MKIIHQLKFHPQIYKSSHKQKTPRMWGAFDVVERVNLCGAERNRTADLLNAIQALSQLSYSPKVSYMQQLDATITDEIKWLNYIRTRVFGTSPLRGVGLDD